MSLMTVASWNVNSIHARLPVVVDWLVRHQPEVVCLQETKVPDERFPLEAFTQLGYQAAFSGQKSYNGVAIISRLPLVDVEAGFPGEDITAQKRLIAASIAGVRLLNVYVPNGSEVGSEKFVYKLDWLKRLRELLDARHSPREQLLVCGDFNIAPEPRDVYDVEAVQGRVLFHPDEHLVLRELEAWGLVDTFRLHHQESGIFSWWDYRAAAFRRNLGMRIDHIRVSPPLAARCTAGWIDPAPRKAEKPSDHVPVLATFDL